MAVDWKQPLDPSDHKDYAADWTDEMALTGDSLSSATVVLESAGLSAGLEISTAQPVRIAGNKVLIWFRIPNSANQSNPLFNGEGTWYAVTVTVITAGSRTLQQTWRLRVAHR